MIETAMLKVFSTDVLWRIINDTIQIFGGKAYFTDEPYERMMRDGRINMIGEGANDVLRAFVALVGMRDGGLELQRVLSALKSPLKNFGRLSDFVGQRVESMFRAPDVGVLHSELEPDASRSASSTANSARSRAIVAHPPRGDRRQRISTRPHWRGGHQPVRLSLRAAAARRRSARAGEALATKNRTGPYPSRRFRFVRPMRSRCGARLPPRFLIVGRYYLKTAARRIETQLASFYWDNDDAASTEAANLLLP